LLAAAGRYASCPGAEEILIVWNNPTMVRPFLFYILLA
jgi:hypothetical protein